MKKVFYAKKADSLLIGYKKAPLFIKREDYVEIDIIPKGGIDNWDYDKIFRYFNHEEYNPLGIPEGQEWLKNNGLHHTSMSVGDIIEDNGKPFICMPEGWKRTLWE